MGAENNVQFPYLARKRPPIGVDFSSLKPFYSFFQLLESRVENVEMEMVYASID